MDGYMCQFDLGERSVLIVHRNAFHGVKCGVCTINDLAENRILVVQMRLFCIGYEELRLVRVGTGVRHGNDTTIVKLQRGPQFVFEGFSPYALATFS